MRPSSFTLVLLLYAQMLQAQFNILPPIVNTGIYAITDTVYMSPDGNDANPGTQDRPVRSFSRAIDLIPFKLPGLPTYGLVRLLPGVYSTTVGFKQLPEQWLQSGAYKNISVEGIGEVIIQGPSPENPANSALLHLLGDHIYVRNLKLKYGKTEGVLIRRDDGSRVHDVIIERVEIDSVKSFGILIQETDRVEVRYCVSRRAARLDEEQLPSNCQWPSGIKFLGCTHATIHHSEISCTRGEGLNFQNTLYGRAYRNILQDNPTHFYCDNSARLLVYQNYLYNTPGSTSCWKTCPEDNLVEAGKAFLIANEGACIKGNLPVFDNCLTKCFLPDESFSNVDSIYIFNNLIQNSGRCLDFWQGNLKVIGINCIRNVFVWHNTFIGTLQIDNHKTHIVHLFLPDFNLIPTVTRGALRNIRIENNLFAFDPSRNIPLVEVFNTFIPGQDRDYLIASNVWSKTPPLSAKVLSSNIERPALPFNLNLLGDTALQQVIPTVIVGTSNVLNADFYRLVPNPAAAYLTEDYLGYSREASLTNVGAFEVQSAVNTHTSAPWKRIKLYPVPVIDELWLDLSPEHGQEDFTVEVYDPTGRLVSMARNAVRISCGHLETGVYYLVLRGDTWLFREVFVKVH